MRNAFISINWTGQPLTPEQQLVIMKIAAYFIRRGSKNTWVDFTHLQCEGRLTYKSSGLFVTFAGHSFHADLGLVNGVRWTIDFLLMRGAEDLLLDEKVQFQCTRWSGGEAVGDFVADPELTRVGEVSLLG